MSGLFEFNDEIICDKIRSNTALTVPTYAADPAIEPAGSIYHNTTDDLVYRSDGTVWVAIGGASSGSNYERDVTVAQSGADYTSIVDALAFAATLTPVPGNKVQIRIFPGTYIESNPIVIPSNVQVLSYAEVNAGQVTVIPANAGVDVFQMSDESGIDGIFIIGGSNSISNTSGTARINSCSFRGVGKAVYTSTSSTSIVSNSTAFIFSSTDTSTYFEVDSGSIFWGTNLVVRNIDTSSATNGIAFKVSTSNMFLNNCSVIGVGTGLDADTSSTVSIQAGRTLNCGIGVDIGEDSTVFVTGHDIVSNTLDSTSVRLKNSTSSLKGVGSRFNSDTIVRVTGSTIECSFYSDSSDEPAQEIRGELHVGSIDTPTESAFGEGDSHTDGMRVFHCTATGTGDDGSSFTEITSNIKFNDLLSSNVFPSTATNACILIGSEKIDYLAGIKVDLELGIVPAGGINGSGTRLVRPEYWDGATWSQMRIMSTDADPGYYPHADSIFDAGSYQFRAGPAITMAIKTINGVTAYWSRYRLIGAITTNPVINKLKLHTNRLEINRDGFTEFFGKAEKRDKYPYSINLAAPVGNSPSNSDIYISDGVRVGRTENRFSTGDEIGFTIELPETIDTSKHFRLEFRFFIDSSLLAIGGDVVMRIRTAFARDIVDDPGALSTIADNTAGVPGTPPGLLSDQNVTISVAPGTGNKLQSYIHNTPITPLISRRNTGSNIGDMLFVHMVRLGGLLGLLSEAIVIVQVIPVYTKWCDGTFL